MPHMRLSHPMRAANKQATHIMLRRAVPANTNRSSSHFEAASVGARLPPTSCQESG